MFDILCDFDGTISTRDVTDLLLSRLAAPGWEAVEAEWEAGRIGSRECMSRQVAMIDATVDEFDAVLAEVEIDPGFPAFLQAATRLGASLTVVSDGLDYAIRRVLGRHGIRRLPVIANRLVATSTHTYRLEHPHARSNCGAGSGTCKCAVAEGRSARPTVLVGDGRSDFCVSAVADFVLAKGALADHCASAHRRHFAFEGFDELTAILPAVVATLGTGPNERARATEAA